MLSGLKSDMDKLKQGSSSTPILLQDFPVPFPMETVAQLNQLEEWLTLEDDGVENCKKLVNICSFYFIQKLYWLFRYCKNST